MACRGGASARGGRFSPVASPPAAPAPPNNFSYLNQLNRPIEADNKRDDLEVQRDAQAIAWACLQQTCRPTTIQKTVALAALKALDEATSP